jgi:hypothetical protein
MIVHGDVGSWQFRRFDNRFAACAAAIAAGEVRGSTPPACQDGVKRSCVSGCADVKILG